MSGRRSPRGSFLAAQPPPSAPPPRPPRPSQLALDRATVTAALGEGGATMRELTAITGLSRYQVSTALYKMQRLGVVCKAGTKPRAAGPNAFGRHQQTVYALVMP